MTNRLRAIFLSSTVLAALAGEASAADVTVQPALVPPPPPSVPPAVSALNGKIDLSAGWLQDNTADGGLFGASGALSVPLGVRFGLQVDVFYKSVAGTGVGGVAGHLFWRDPRTALLGIYGSYTTVGPINVWRAAVEGEYYLGNISLEGLFGWENPSGPTPNGSDIFAVADLAFYPTEDLRLSVGYRRWNSLNMAALGAEYQFSRTLLGGGAGGSLFVEGRLGEQGVAAVWGGVRLYAAPVAKSLIRRHREDDPKVKSENEQGVGCPAGTTYDSYEGECLSLIEY